MRSSVRAVCRFLITALLLQALCLLLCTPEAVSLYFPAFVLFCHETIVCGDDSYTDYYSLRERIENATAIVLGIDRTRAESYVFIEDLLTSLRYGSSVGSIMFTWTDEDTAEWWNHYFYSYLNDDEELEYYESLLLEKEEPEYHFRFHEILAKMNRTLPPQKRFIIVPGTSNGNRTETEIENCIETASQENEGIVFVLTDADTLSDPGTRLRTDTERYLCLQCRYSETPEIPFFDFGEPLWLVHTQRMGFYNEWYSLVSSKLGRSERHMSYTKNYSTEPFLLFFYEPEKENVKDGT